MLLYPIGRATKMKEVAKAHMDPVGGLFEGKPFPPLYACVRVQELLKSSYEDNEIDIPISDGNITLGQFVGITIMWDKRDTCFTRRASTSDSTGSSISTGPHHQL